MPTLPLLAILAGFFTQFQVYAQEVSREVPYKFTLSAVKSSGAAEPLTLGQAFGEKFGYFYNFVTQRSSLGQNTFTTYGLVDGSIEAYGGSIYQTSASFASESETLHATGLFSNGSHLLPGAFAAVKPDGRGNAYLAVNSDSEAWSLCTYEYKKGKGYENTVVRKPDASKTPGLENCYKIDIELVPV